MDFLGGWPFPCENPRFWVLDFLGFPWILSSESSLFNGLRGKTAENIFGAPALASRSARTEGAVEAMRKRRIVHGASLP